MAELTIYNKSGEDVGSCEVDWQEFAPKINTQLLHDVVVMYQANRRQGSHRTKSRGEVAGSRQKLFRQKGTGRARQGSKKAAHRRGGGHVHYKRPRDYSYRLPRKAVRLATRMAIASKFRDNEVVVIDELSFDAPKTREMAEVLNALELDGASVLVATAERDVNVYKSGRNIHRVNVSYVSDLNALTVLTPRRLLLTKAALEQMRQRAAAGEGAPDSPDEANPTEES